MTDLEVWKVTHHDDALHRARHDEVCALAQLQVHDIWIAGLGGHVVELIAEIAVAMLDAVHSTDTASTHAAVEILLTVDRLS